MRKLLTNIIDFFYPPFRRLMPLQTFRYAACGGANTLIGLTVYLLGLIYFNNKNVDFGFVVLKPHNAALFLSAIVSYLVGFIFNKFLVFTESNLRARIQLFRYGVSFLVNLCINYFILRLFVEILHIQEFVAQIMASVVVISFSYLTQKHFTFRSKG
ncbi:GtrA family protein [Ferruginibacter sp. HRS2-29]|uniref:GtrA family protein n=1 Tax=Ferruginibacter sp. HRS2-29 TaxID=2487334 RepID=UPI0020CD1F2A|nr:GtrA family protein [Ferruginibacter sp. HRS2-29]MCP9751112.1 GtrA family protein [Ferruginibacter sp. HRS2-29]